MEHAESVTISALTHRILTSALNQNSEVHIYLKKDINLKKNFGKENILFFNRDEKYVGYIELNKSII